MIDIEVRFLDGDERWGVYIGTRCYGKYATRQRAIQRAQQVARSRGLL